jgi:hypothetical protein
VLVPDSDGRQFLTETGRQEYRFGDREIADRIERSWLNKYAERKNSAHQAMATISTVEQLKTFRPTIYGTGKMWLLFQQMVATRI